MRAGGGGHTNPPADTVLCQLTHNATAEKRGSVGGTDGKRREKGRDATAALTRACRLGGRAIRWTHTAEGLNEVHCCLRKLICLWTPMRQESSSNKEEGVHGPLDEQNKSEKVIKREKREKNPQTSHNGGITTQSPPSGWPQHSEDETFVFHIEKKEERHMKLWPLAWWESRGELKNEDRCLSGGPTLTPTNELTGHWAVKGNQYCKMCLS